MLPLLQRLAAETKPVAVRQYLDSVADAFGLSEDERAERLPSGGENLLLNRLAWARTYLGKAGLLTSPRHGQIEISSRGREVLSKNLPAIDVRFLRQFPEFQEWIVRSQRPKGVKEPAIEVVASDKSEEPPSVDPADDEGTPRERIDAAKQEIETALQEDLLQRVRAMAASDFEDSILRLLLAMGYGQGLDEMARALGGSGDGGMDGVIHQDPLGLERVYIQAKRWKEGNNVGPHEIRDFVGALNIHRANKGVFVTASQFTGEANKAANNSTVQVVLIDGRQLTELMIRYKVGVLVRDVIEIKAVDEGFFE
ncbi:MAG: restriction endonuclease [Alphaproteobacteria bacterium]|nr:restriction endonuclease [Alphaproteobacteria bacterium]